MESTTSRSKGQRRWPYLTIILALVIALLGVLIWGLDRENRRANRARQVTSLLTQSYYELVDGVGSLNNDLMKLMVSASPGTNVALLSRLSAQAQSAAESLAALPGGHGALQGAMGFLNQVGDMSGSLLKKTGSGLPLSQSELEQIDQLAVSCQQIYQRLSQLDPQEVVRYEDSDFYEAAPEGAALAQALGGSGEQAMEYPSLIYDGPFSDSLKGLGAKGLEGLPVVDEAQARKVAAQVLWMDEASVTAAGSEQGQIEAYLFAGQEQEMNVTAAITRQGGKLLWMMADRTVSEAAISLQEAERIAAAAADQWGFGTVRPSWSQSVDGIATVSLIPTVGEAGVYPDMIKVKIALDNGQILGMDATAYWMNHVGRTLPAVAISRTEAADLVSAQLAVENVQLAVIPTDGGGEKLCWEVEATFGSGRFFVYLDGQTGQEVQIFRVIETEEGMLTMRAGAARS